MVEPARLPEHAPAAAPDRVPGHPPEDAAAAAPVPVPGHPVEHAAAAAPVPVPGRPPDEPAFALLIDGTAVRIRQIGPGDLAAVRDLHRGMSPDNLYLRFFGLSPRLADETSERLCRAPGPDHAVLGAWLGEDLIGVANYEPAGVPGAAEIALAVADAMHHRGVGTLLLEHLVSLARARGVREFRADTLLQNAVMLRVFASAGLTVERGVAGGVVDVRMPLTLDGRYLDAVAERERSADVASLRHLLCPASIAVVGAGPAGGAILRTLVSGRFPGAVSVVDPRAGTRLAGVPCAPSVAALPEAPELAVLAVPPESLAEVAEECGRRGVRALVVITPGGDGPALLATCRRYGMRLVGPGSHGVANSAVRLDATFAALPVRPGAAGIVAQSGGVGIALRDHLSRLDVGVSSFASVGDKYDVSSNDLLLWWEADPATRLGVLHVESYGNPRKFARTARRVGRRVPLLTVVAGRSAAGRRAATSHAAGPTSAVTQEALFRQAGITATHGLGELLDTAALLAHQPVPAGDRVAIVANAGGAGVLAADACADVGLTTAALSEETVRRLTRLLPRGAACAGPVDTTAAIDPERFTRCLDLVAADDGVDAVLALVVPTALSDLTAAVAAGGAAKPFTAVVLGQPESVRVRYGPGGRRVPSYAFPEDAARALGHARSHGRWLERPAGSEPVLPDVREDTVTRIIRRFLDESPEGGPLPPADVPELLAAYGLPPAGPGPEPSAGARRTATGEVELRCGIVQEPVFGPLVVFGLGGAATEVLGDRAARLTPLTDVDAAELIRSVRGAPLLFGHHGAPVVDTAAVEDVLLRLSRLADDHPDIAEVDLDPVIARPAGVVVAGARVRVVPARHWDPHLRRLR
ncbi:GNAT family N-acetyltransferase [Actinoallomurus spadix]|uniref:N-acetyltransferase domain-containing protein n=1 Tax=Actinoallomurus spadix TaxID=79912 RepID=A0ABN0VXT8_9ACTN|nr:GNAT family N-acetyltransferase [Actinoallomurus spadix]MCO5985980.1 GNAT family N-acetyltransferase [Actinoallomurus spadix]